MTSNCWVVNQNFQLVQSTMAATLCPLTFSALARRGKMTNYLLQKIPLK